MPKRAPASDQSPSGCESPGAFPAGVPAEARRPRITGLESTSADRRRVLQVLVIAAAAVLGPGGPGRPADAGGVTLPELRQAGRLRIGLEAAYVPFGFRKDGKIVGFDVDLAEIFCARLGVRPAFIDTAWAGVISSLYARKFDVIMSGVSYTPERLQRVAFTIPYAEAAQALLIRAADAGTIRGLDDLTNRVVGVKLGSPGEVLVKKHAAEIRSRQGAGFAEVKLFNDHPAAYLALSQGRLDAVYNTIPTLSVVLRDQPGRFAIVRGIGADNWAGIVARKEDVELIEFLDGEIRRLKTDGTLYELQEKWFGFRMRLPDAVPTP
jgi:polar amino acid transport system substrate-binding protein